MHSNEWEFSQINLLYPNWFDSELFIFGRKSCRYLKVSIILKQHCEWSSSQWIWTRLWYRSYTCVHSHRNKLTYTSVIAWQTSKCQTPEKTLQSQTLKRKIFFQFLNLFYFFLNFKVIFSYFNGCHFEKNLVATSVRPLVRSKSVNKYARHRMTKIRLVRNVSHARSSNCDIWVIS